MKAPLCLPTILCRSPPGIRSQGILLRWALPQLAGLLASIVECSDDAIVAYDPDGTLLSWNRGAEAIFGYSTARCWAGIITILETQERHVNLARFLDTLLSGRSVSQYRGFGLCRDNGRAACFRNRFTLAETAGVWWPQSELLSAIFR